MEISGVVREWHDELGWGVVDSEATPGGCWVHFSQLAMPGFRALRAGQHVTFTCERPVGGQDGYAYRAIQVRPQGVERYIEAPSTMPSDAYSSELRLTWDDGPGTVVSTETSPG